VVTEGRRHARGREVVDPIVKRLEAVGPDEPLFVFGHLTEPHAPYDRGKKRSGSNWEKYLSEVDAADELVGRVMTVLSRGPLAKRSLLIVSSDHGEAFGEHGTYEHTKTIYEEQLRVPLLFWGAGVKAQRVEEPVNLVDLGPTLLDWFGVDTPDFMAGESLLPTVLEGPRALSRPLFAEGRLRRAIFIGDLKVIVDERRKTVEAFDLATDPAELTNVYESDPARVRPALAALHRYFERRSASRDGYRPIYKP
jgi:arylsulfatase A-like enzyme